MSMFCYQCEQTAGGKGCQVNGVCGKNEAIANKQDEIIAALIQLSRAVKAHGAAADSDRLLMEGLFATLTNVNFDPSALDQLLCEIKAQAAAIGLAEPYDAKLLWAGEEDIRSLRSTLLFGLKGVAAYAYHTYGLHALDQTVIAGLYDSLCALAQEHTVEDWLQLLMGCGQLNLKCMASLDAVHTMTYGHPEPTEVTLTVEAGPFIVVTGHDLHDLHMLLEQTAGKGINIYTHGEMLPAHAYPAFKAFDHLKGHFGTAWNNQQQEFDGLPAPILYTTNCIMVPKASYEKQIYTTAVVHYPGTVHLNAQADGHKDFTPLIEAALALGGYSEAQERTGANGGRTLLTGFAHHTVLGVADQVVDAVKAGAIKHFFLVGGCDGAKNERSYYTDFVKQTPDDTVVLTLACGKFRFNDLDLGTIGELPRLMDMGQCNDAYSAIKVAVALAQAFDCDVNELPLTLVLSWYEQKAVSIVLTLLSLGIKNIYIGPSIPAFFSDNVLKVLVDQFAITPISTPEADLKKILG